MCGGSLRHNIRLQIQEMMPEEIHRQEKSSSPFDQRWLCSRSCMPSPQAAAAPVEEEEEEDMDFDLFG